MSRSYKKFPAYKQGKSNNRQMNRQIRHSKLTDIPSGGAYKKCTVSNSRKDIWLWKNAKNEYKNNFGISTKYSLIEWYRVWIKSTLRK